MKRLLAIPYVQVALILLGIILLCGAAAIGSVFWVLSEQPKITSLEANSRMVEQVLDLAQKHPSGPFLEEAIAGGYEWSHIRRTLSDQPSCWQHLQARAQTSAYEIRARQNPGQERDVDDSTVKVLFSDGSVVEFFFYQHQNYGCSVR